MIHATTMSWQHVVEEVVMVCERGTSPGNMLFFFFAKHSSQSNCTFEMLFFGCFSPNNSLGSMFPLICSLPHFSPNSPHEMLLSICSSWDFSPSGSWGSMGLSNCFSSWSLPKKLTMLINQQKGSSCTCKKHVPCNIPMGLAANDYTKKYM